MSIESAALVKVPASTTRTNTRIASIWSMTVSFFGSLHGIVTTKIQTVLLTGKTHTTASRSEGAPRGDDRVDIQLSTPGNPGNEIAFTAIQLHPTAEQLFAGA